MGDVYCIDGFEFFSIESYLDRTFHEVSDSIIRKPCIDEYTHILIFGVFDIDEEFGMSEWCDDHGGQGKSPLRGFLGVIVLEMHLELVS